MTGNFAWGQEGGIRVKKKKSRTYYYESCPHCPYTGRRNNVARHIGSHQSNTLKYCSNEFKEKIKIKKEMKMSYCKSAPCSQNKLQWFPVETYIQRISRLEERVDELIF
jgi:hypothetical protein